MNYWDPFFSATGLFFMFTKQNILHYEVFFMLFSLFPEAIRDFIFSE